MVSRREFIKAISIIGSAAVIRPDRLLGRYNNDTNGYFGVHPFIENNPDAVFIMRTDVDSIENSTAKLQAGLDFSKTVFVPKSLENGGFPLDGNILLKPNLTCRYSTDSRYTIESTQGIQTDCYFVEGIINGIKELGAAGDRFYLRETNCPQDFDDGGYIDLAERTGANIKDLVAPVGEISEDDLNWIDVPDGVWFNKIAYLWPANAADTYLINIAKFKSHVMGMTLCAKNLQGLNAMPYIRHCILFQDDMAIPPEHVQPNAKTKILENYERRKNSIPRWDRPGINGGLWHETWATRCLDNNSVTKAGLHIIEGLYGRDGHFINGPHNGLAQDFLSNIIVFGKNPFNVDIIGCWLGGHEPGNFGLFHMAMERQMTSFLNPRDVPLYEWKTDGTAQSVILDQFERTPLKTMYLTRDYNGQTEDMWHLVDEYYDYSQVALNDTPVVPPSFELHQNYPNPFNQQTSFEFILPESGNARIEIFDSRGRRVDIIVDGYHGYGPHLAVWKADRFASGVYYYRLGYSEHWTTKSMTLLK